MAMSKKDKAVFKILKEKNIDVYQAEKQFYEDSNSGDFRDFPDYESMTPEQIAEAVINNFKENWTIVKKTTPENHNYDYEKENFKSCPVCGKAIDYHIDGFYHDTILNKWICREHKLQEIFQKIELKDKDLIEFIKAGEAGKEIVYI